jgi:excisionase family DNA binding protein
MHPTKPNKSESQPSASSIFSVSPRGFRIEDAAIYMGVSPWFVEAEIRAGHLPALKLCRHYTLLREDLDAYLDAARNKLRE